MREAKKWLEKAENDMEDARFNLENSRQEAAAFFSHQAAEKALKALYINRFKRLWKIHDLKALGRKVNAPHSVIKSCDALNPHYIQTRYPLDVSYTQDMAEEAFENAAKVVKWAKKRLTTKS